MFPAPLRHKQYFFLDVIARLARIRYREGVADYLEVLDAERNLFTAEQSLISLRRQELDNLAALYAALGGGLPPN